MIQRLSAAAAEQHPISRIVRKCHSTSTHALGHFSAAVEPIAAAQSIIRRQGQHYCCWRQLIRAVDIHIQWKFNQCEACQRYNLAGGPEYTTTTRDSQANQSKNSINDIWQIIDPESISYTINIIRIHKFIVVIVDKLSTAYTIG
jgi:hypothetical protein